MGTSGKDYTDAKVEAVRAQNDARFAEVLSKLSHIPSTGSMAWMFAGSVVTVVGLMLAAMAFGGDRFDAGVQVSSVSVQQAVEARQIAERNAEQVNGLNRKMDTLIELLQKRVER